MLQSGELTAARAKHAIEVIGRNARLQAQLIEDILDVSRIIAGKLEIQRVPMSLVQLLDTAVSDISPAAEAKSVTLRQDIVPDLPPLEADPKRLHQILNNVLSNAIKFTPEGGAVTLRCAADAGGIAIEVEDTGIGIAPDFLPYVFDRFRQADSRATRAHGGLGLGLAIARHLVEQHGGTIEARSDGAGRGTTVSIHLPAGPAGVGTKPPPTAAAEVVRLDGISVLVLDDEQDSREMLATLLAQHGADVVQSPSAQSAMQMLRDRPVQMVVADIAMPQIDGYEFIRRVRAEGSTVPAIAVTAFARFDDRRRALDCGYSAYLAKPIDALQLAKTVRELVPAPTTA
jgi:CheY-like chemotaxis protein